MTMRKPIHNVVLNPNTGKIIAKKRVITLFTIPKNDDTWSIYHCPDCKNPIAQYKGDLVAEIPGEAPTHYPIMVQCKNPKCGRKILFSDAAEQMI